MEITLARTTEQSSRQLIRAALGPDGQEGPHTRYLNGAYMNCDSVTECSDFVISKEGYAAQEKIWVCLLISARTIKLTHCLFLG